MRCKFCGAEIGEGNNVCEYCGSAVESERTKTTAATGTGKDIAGIFKVTGKIIISLACIFAVMIIVTMVIVLNSDTFKNMQEYSVNRYSANEIPENEKGLSGQIISCDQNGIAVIEYMGQTYEDIKILDKDLLTWIKDTGRTLDSVGICFTTDEKGDISELGLLSSDFFVMTGDGDHYIAVRDDQVISFMSSIPLDVGHYYGGYFSYPNMSLYQEEEKDPFSMTYMDLKCSDKESVIEQEYYTGQDITVYKICVGGKWYYCTEDTYDTIETGDLLSGYDMCENEGLAFIISK